MIPYGRQEITKEDIDAVIDVLKSDYITQGPKVPQFEKAAAQKIGVEHAIAVNSATSALHLSCLALGVREGDLVWTTPITFVASANCALYCGADIDFVDIDSRTYNMSVTELRSKLAKAETSGRLPKVVIPVHLCGQSCDMAAIHSLSRRYGFKIIEDASHAIGGKYRDEPVGNCRYSDITVFSFHPVKIITTGEGGMALTNDAELAHRMSLLRTHGITRDPEKMPYTIEGPWAYQQVDLGYNYRMTDIQAALGISQLNRLDDYLVKRKNVVDLYNALLSDFPIVTPWQHPTTSSAWHLYVIRLDLDKINTTRREVFNLLRDNGVGVNIHYIPVHTQPWFQKLGFRKGMFPKAEKYYDEAITMPIFPKLREEEQIQVVYTLKKALELN